MTYVFVRLHRNFNPAAYGQFLSLLGCLGFCVCLSPLCLAALSTRGARAFLGLAPVHTIDRVKKVLRLLGAGGCASPPAPAPTAFNGVALAGLRKWRRAIYRYRYQTRARKEEGKEEDHRKTSTFETQHVGSVRLPPVASTCWLELVRLSSFQSFRSTEFSGPAGCQAKIG